ncbi:MAG TPA: ATP-binding cassette domain-containing protein [Gemmatimonadaceae bacterium]|nr:ATP-binding cassette domain-containing protein [Gemmatimonadaceae bacterium]
MATLLVQDLHARHGDREILCGVTFDVAPGEIVALMGTSGAGKSTALRALVALQPFTRGSVAIGDVALRPGRIPAERFLHGLRRSIGLVFQAPSLFPHLTAVDNVTLAPIHALHVSRDDAERRAEELLAELGIAPRAHAYPHELSGGEAQRVAIARALALDPTVLLLDEPTAALDPARRTALGQTLRQLAREGRGLLVATHDVDFAGAFTDRVAVLAEGRIVEEGESPAVLGSPKHEATRKLLHHERSI